LRFQRCELLFGDDFNKIKNAKIILFGVGYEITNQNRQIGSEAVGKDKTEVLSTLYPGISYITNKVTKDWINNFNFNSYNLVIDAIDDIPAKVALALKTYTKLISSCGGAKRIDSTLIDINDIWKTTNDPFAKKFRYELKNASLAIKKLTIS